MFVAATTACFPELSLLDVLSKLTDLEYSAVEITIHEHGPQLKPSHVANDLEAAVNICRNTHRLDLVAFDLEFDAPGETYYEQFAAICRLAKATKVVTLTVPCGELGTPFNEEVERLRRLVSMAELNGARVAIKNQVGRLSENPDTALSLLENVKGLGLTLDPSHYICSPLGARNYDHLLKYVIHTRLRDTSKTQLQVRIGQGEVDYGKLIASLGRFNYQRALCVEITPAPDVDHDGEMRKLRLLLESML